MVERRDDLKIIIDHFDKYSLQSTKIRNYYLFIRGMNVLYDNVILSKDNIQELLSIKSLFPTGISPNHLSYFTDFISSSIIIPNYIQPISYPLRGKRLGKAV